MKKIFLFVVPVLLFALACTKDISRFNQETKRPASVPGGTLFSNGTRNFADAMASASVNTNPFRFVVNHWAMAVYQDEVQYNFSTRNIPQTWWTTMYRDVLNDLKESARIIGEDAALLPGVQKNQLASIEVMQVYTYFVLVNTFGDIPYSEALDPDGTLFPKYDDAKTVYTDLLKRITDAIGSFDPASVGFASAEDNLYKGNVAKWIKFANSLRLKMGMVIADDDAAAAKTHVEAANAGAFTSSADDALFSYLGSTPNTNPLYADIVLGGRGDYIAADNLMTKLISLDDPRKSLYFGTNNAGEYKGGVSGVVTGFSAASKPSDKVSGATAPQVLLDYAEIEFLRAEAIERGFAVGGTAAEHYNNAVRASIIWWGGTPAQADAYLAKPEVAYATAAGDWRQKIGTQKWIALYNRSFDAWLELRRLNYPAISLPVGAQSGFPNRFQYPNNEQQLNGVNYTAAAAKMGGDEVETKLWWDK
jgi:hypothetical protein